MSCKKRSHWRHVIRLYRTNMNSSLHNNIDAYKTKTFEVEVYCTEISQQGGSDMEVGGQVMNTPSIVKVKTYNLLSNISNDNPTPISFDIKSNIGRWGAEFNNEQYTLQSIEFENALLTSEYIYLLLKRNNDKKY